MIHIVFEQPNVTALEKAIELDESLQGQIVEIKDDFAVGPLGDIYHTEGYQARRSWWETLLEHSPYADTVNIVDDKLAVHNLLKMLDEQPEAEAWIWMGQNAHDVCSYYWLMPQLKDYQGRIQVLYLNNLPFINEKGSIFYPTHLHEIQPKEFLKAKKLARPITLSEFELDPDEWKKLCNENALVRFLEGGKKIVSKDVDFYDKDLLAHLNGAMKLSKLIYTALGKMKVKTGDVFLVWRIKEMAAAGKLELAGDWSKGWKEVVVKFPGAAETTETTEAETTV
ncbi:DUF1835 domain-containing protein [Sediminibacterium ginsengisoli]|uniref:DUF1835 domain-containing protein n=1 Tax=Sediminibacterium ginsengisoli TaxID=413434 RepID=A0A1T4NW02_9BACT|nr:DUF1835 domain-containing protein [Sediminibacterium ginsengisoli]SJZ83401.1 Protein of unknown function [Sediminibacterium ginsengisoli]